MQGDPVSRARREWRVGLIVMILLFFGSVVLFRRFAISHDQGEMFVGLLLFIAGGLLLPIVSNRRADGDPAYAKGYRAASAALLFPGSRLQIGLLLLVGFLVMIPVERVMGWIYRLPGAAHAVGVVTLKEVLVAAGLVSFGLVFGTAALIRAWRKPSKDDDELI